MAPFKNLPSALSRDTLKNDLHFFNLRLRATTNADDDADRTLVRLREARLFSAEGPVTSLIFSLVSDFLAFARSAASHAPLRVSSIIVRHERRLRGTRKIITPLVLVSPLFDNCLRVCGKIYE